MDTEFSLGTISILATESLTSHAAGFQVDDREGVREFCFVYFHSDVVLEDVSGRRIRASGTGVFYLPHQARYYHAVSGPLRHIWFLAVGPGIDGCLQRYRIPTFTALDLRKLSFLETFIQDVRREGLQRQAYYEEAISNLSHEFFRRVGAILADNAEVRTEAQQKKLQLLGDIRLRVHSDLVKRWSVQEMAEIAHLNPTRFAMDYKSQFGVSPIDDLIHARLKRAEYMLKHLPYTTRQIALECGFHSAEHFTRLFHERRGCTPGQFRRF